MASQLQDMSRPGRVAVTIVWAIILVLAGPLAPALKAQISGDLSTASYMSDFALRAVEAAEAGKTFRTFFAEEKRREQSRQRDWVERWRQPLPKTESSRDLLADFDAFAAAGRAYFLFGYHAQLNEVLEHALSNYMDFKSHKNDVSDDIYEDGLRISGHIIGINSLYQDLLASEIYRISDVNNAYSKYVDIYEDADWQHAPREGAIAHRELWHAPLALFFEAAAALQERADSRYRKARKQLIARADRLSEALRDEGEPSVRRASSGALARIEFYLFELSFLASQDKGAACLDECFLQAKQAIGHFDAAGMQRWRAWTALRAARPATAPGADAQAPRPGSDTERLWIAEQLGHSLRDISPVDAPYLWARLVQALETIGRRLSPHMPDLAPDARTRRAHRVQAMAIQRMQALLKSDLSEEVKQ